MADTVGVMRLYRLRAWLPLLALAAPSIALAHTKWFAHGPIPPYAANEPVGIYLLAWAVVSLGIIGIGVALERAGRLGLSFLKPSAPHAFERAATVFSMVAGAFLLIAATHDYLFSPNLDTGAGIPAAFIVLELLIGLALLVGVYDRIAAFALGLLWGAVWLVAGPIAALENVWVLSAAAFIAIMGNDYFRFTQTGAHGAFLRRYEPYALPLLRLGTGATLLVLGFSEKILHPEYGVNFLAQHDWNFMQLAGIPYSDVLFTLSAGSVEALFGLVFLLGAVTRLNALALAVFFTAPLFILGPIELAGHMPHFAAVVLLLLFGSGERLKIPAAVAQRVPVEAPITSAEMERVAS